jgi:hypothetical protein
MGGTRKRFTSAERGAFVPGTAVEYLSGSRWYPATVAGDPGTDALGEQYIELSRDHELTKTMLTGPVRGYPKRVRLPEEQRTGAYV